MTVSVQMFKRMAREESLHGWAKKVGKRQIDGPGRAVEVKSAKEFVARFHKPFERGQPFSRERQTLGSEETVMQQAIEVERLGTMSGHIAVAEHKIHVVDRVDPAEERSQQM